MLVLGVAEQKQLLTMKECVDAVSTALSEYSKGNAISPERIFLPVPSAEGTSIFMPSLVDSCGSVGLKFVSIFPNNKKVGKKTLNGIFVLADSQTGEPLAMLEASYLTALRTGAASGLATKLLSRENSKVLAVIGTGAQAWGIVRAIMAVRDIQEIRLFNRNHTKAELFADELRQDFGEACPNISIFHTANQAIEGADVIATATNSSTPVFSKEYVLPGVHINAVGAFRPHMQEIPSELVQSANKIVVESREGAMDEAGDLLIPIAEGLITLEDIYAEIGEIVNGDKAAREDQTEITLFKSVGLAAMDVIVAKAMYERAQQMSMGQRVTL